MKTSSHKPTRDASPAAAERSHPAASQRASDPAEQFARAELYGHRLASEPSPGHRLPAPVQRKMEASLGADFSRVRIHQGEHVEKIGASAYTRGERIHFAPGRYNPHSPEGQRMLGHELAHVVQQRQGRVARGAHDAINDHAGLEAEADRLGDAAARGQTANPVSQASSPASTAQ